MKYGFSRSLDPPTILRGFDMFERRRLPARAVVEKAKQIEQGRDVGESEWIYPPIRKYRMKNRLYMEVAMGKSWTDWGFSIDMFDNRFDGNQY